MSFSAVDSQRLQSLGEMFILKLSGIQTILNSNTKSKIYLNCSSGDHCYVIFFLRIIDVQSYFMCNQL